MNSKDYWKLRSKESLAESFATTEELVDYYNKLLETQLERYVAKYNELLKPFNKDGVIDEDALRKAMVYDMKFLAKKRRLEEEIYLFSKELNTSATKKLTKAFEKVYKKNYMYTLEPLGIKTKLDKEAITAAVKTPWTANNREFSELIWIYTNNMQAEVRKCVSEGIANGWNPRKTAKEFARVMGNTAYNAQRLIRTETIAIFSKSSIAAYEESGVVDSVEIIGDECDSCGSGIVKLTDAAIGDTIPPFHPNCKCAVAPVVNLKKIKNFG